VSALFSLRYVSLVVCLIASSDVKAVDTSKGCGEGVTATEFLPDTAAFLRGWVKYATSSSESRWCGRRGLFGACKRCKSERKEAVIASSGESKKRDFWERVPNNGVVREASSPLPPDNPPGIVCNHAIASILTKLLVGQSDDSLASFQDMNACVATWRRKGDGSGTSSGSSVLEALRIARFLKDPCTILLLQLPQLLLLYPSTLLLGKRAMGRNRVVRRAPGLAARSGGVGGGGP